MRTHTRNQFLRGALRSPGVPFDFLNGRGHTGMSREPALALGAFPVTWGGDLPHSSEGYELQVCHLGASGRVIMHANFIHEIQTWKEMPPNFYDLKISYVLSYASD